MRTIKIFGFSENKEKNNRLRNDLKRKFNGYKQYTYVQATSDYEKISNLSLSILWILSLTLQNLCIT